MLNIKTEEGDLGKMKLNFCYAPLFLPWPTICLFPPRTGTGRAIRTAHWFLYGKTLAWDYDRMKLKDIIPVPVMLNAKVSRDD